MSDGGGVVQWGLDGVIAVALTVGGGIVQALRGDHRELERRHDALASALPETYARRDDVKDVKSDLKLINEKLDRLIERR